MKSPIVSAERIPRRKLTKLLTEDGPPAVASKLSANSDSARRASSEIAALKGAQQPQQIHPEGRLFWMQTLLMIEGHSTGRAFSHTGWGKYDPDIGKAPHF